MKLSENIRELRKEKNLRQEQLAEAMGVSTASVSKWETGQCAPELTVLMELADFFQVSMDTLVGHNLNGSHLGGLMTQLHTAVQNREETTAEHLCETILRCYPNDTGAVEVCADSYYRLFAYTDKEMYMERCIAQTKRLMDLKRGEPEKARIERYQTLGNQYAFLKRWDTAMEYYEQSNVGGCCNASIASCMLEQGETQDAVVMLSETLMKRMFSNYQAVHNLADGWLALGEKEKACAALEWLSHVMESMDYNSTLRMLTQVKLVEIYRSAGQEERAIEAFRRAVKQIETGNTGAQFLQTEMKQEVLISVPGNDEELLKQLAEKLGTPFVQILEEMLA